MRNPYLFMSITQARVILHIFILRRQKSSFFEKIENELNRYLKKGDKKGEGLKKQSPDVALCYIK